jgi:uncharacterized protein (TIGR00369 family)
MGKEIDAHMANVNHVKQPNSRMCFACGIENPIGLGLKFYEIGPGEIVAEPILSEAYQGYPGVVHGGIVACMLDEAAGRAVLVGDHNHFRLTAKLEIRFRKPVPTNQPLRLLGRVINQRGKVATAYAEITLPDGSVASEANAVLIDLPEYQVDDETLEALGWKVYPD